MNGWLSDNYIELFGALAGVIYVFLEIRQTIWLWPVGLITSAVYVWIFFTSKLYADMSLQAYYVIISILGWYWWMRGERENGRKVEAERGRKGEGENEKLQVIVIGKQREIGGDSPLEGGQGDVLKGEMEKLRVTRLEAKTGIVLSGVFLILYFVMWITLSKLTDSPVPGWDAFLTSLSVIATWMLARKIYEHWYLWIVVNIVSSVLYFTRGLYPTVVLYIVYAVMSFIGLKAWRSTIKGIGATQPDNL